MTKLLLISHGDFAKEIYNTVKMIYGEPKNVSYLQLPYGCDLEEYKNNIIKHVEQSDELLILADLFGGSPFMTSCKVFGDPSYNSKMELITGMNLPMVLEVVSQMEYKNLKELKETALNAGINGIADLREKLG